MPFFNALTPAFTLPSIPLLHSSFRTGNPVTALHPHQAPYFPPRAVALDLSPTPPPSSTPTPLPSSTSEPLDQTTAPPPLPDIFVNKSFASLGLSPSLIEALTAQFIHHPTHIQSRSIPIILSNVDVILGAATGSGKTLAYLLPVIQMLKQAEHMREENDPPLRVPRRPRSIVIVPTRELAEQVLVVAKSLAHFAKFRVVAVTGGSNAVTGRKLKQKFDMPVDVLVSTTGRLLQLLDDRVVDVRFVQHVIIDEVDTMFDEGFGPELRKILRSCKGGKAKDNAVQSVLVGATHPKAAEEVYREEFPDAKRIDVDLHVVPRGMTQRFVTVGGNGKVGELLAFLGERGRNGGELRGGRMMVFCNTVDSCRFLDLFLAESGYTTACIHGDVPADRREDEYALFKDGKRQLLVCTDMAARGLDNLKVDHVVLFDFPGSAVDYIHRAGRTARAGAKGRVTSFVTKRDLKLARAIEKAGMGMSDTLESARRAREEDIKRKKKEEEAARENAKRLAETAQSEDGEVGLPARKDVAPKRFGSGSGMGSRGTRGGGRGGGGRGGGGRGGGGRGGGGRGSGRGGGGRGSGRGGGGRGSGRGGGGRGGGRGGGGRGRGGVGRGRGASGGGSQGRGGGRRGFK